jgi:hypothetical protein
MAQPELGTNPPQELASPVEIEAGLTQLVKLFDDWKMAPQDWLLIDEFALWLQGIKRVGPEIKDRNFDVWVDFEKLPWRPPELDIYGKRIMAKHVYPPLKEEIGKQYIDCMSRAHFGVKIRLGTQKDVQSPSTSYPLPEGRSVRLITPEAQIRKFYENTLMRQTETDVGFAKLREWEEKLLGYHTAAEAIGNINLAAKIEVMHMEALARHPKLQYSAIEEAFALFGEHKPIYDDTRSISR